MKRKITVRLSKPLFKRLDAAAKRPGASKTAIVEAALNCFLNADTSDHALLLRRLNAMSRQLEQLDRDLSVVNETVSLHARYHLTVTPPLTNSEQRAACALGLERFEAFATQVGRRIHLGTPLMRETMDRLNATNPHLFERDIAEGASLGVPSADPEPDGPSTLVNEQPEISAVAQEGGSNGCFPYGSHRRPRRSIPDAEELDRGRTSAA